MHEYASDWLERRRVGEIGDGPLNESTYQDYLWRLKKQVLPFFGPMPVARISDADCRRFRGKLFKDSDALKKIAAAGGRAEDENGRQREATLTALDPDDDAPARSDPRPGSQGQGARGQPRPRPRAEDQGSQARADLP